MNEKEVAELRRRFRPDRNSITHVRGCYVNETGEIVSQFNQSIGLMTEDESERFLGLLRKTMSGSIGKNLLNIDFDTAHVLEGEEHKLLMTLRGSALEDEEAVQQFFQLVISCVSLHGSYLILLARDAYDVPYRSKDDERQPDASPEVFTYILCSICPVKRTKPALSYQVEENAFHMLASDCLVAPPELGFVFPAFDDRTANIYSTLYYTRSITQHQEAFLDTLFRCQAPMPAAAQKEAFQEILCETLEEDCSFEIIQGVHDRIREMIEAHKETKEVTPLTINKETVCHLLEDCGVSEERMEQFNLQYDASFGESTELMPKNIVDTKQFQVKTPDVIIHVNPARSDLIKIETINGQRYILIRVDEGVEINGVNIHIP